MLAAGFWARGSRQEKASVRLLCSGKKLAANGSRLGEVAEHKTSLKLQMFKLKIKCQ